MIRLQQAIRQHRRRAVSRIEVLAVILVLVVAAWFFIPRGISNAEENQAICLSNLNKIGLAIEAYLQVNDQRWPYVAKQRTFDIHDPPWPTLSRVLAGYHSETSDVLRCPADSRELEKDDPLVAEFGRSTTWFETEGLSYGWLWAEAYGGYKVGEEVLAQAKGFGQGRADRPLLRDFQPFHKLNGIESYNTLFADFRARPANIERP